MKVLIYFWYVFNHRDIVDAFENLGITTVVYKHPEAMKKNRDLSEFEQLMGDCDFVFTINYFPEISNVCEKNNKKYVSWTVDAPMMTLLHTSVFNKCNYIFIFDRFDCCNIKSLGVEKVFYLPLAVNSDRLQHQLSQLGASQLEKYKADISFIGSLYDKNSYDRIEPVLPEYLKGYFDACFEAQIDVYGDNVIDKMLTTDICAKLLEIIDFKKDEESFSDIKTVFSLTYLGFKLAQIERKRKLLALSRRFETTLYTDGAFGELPGVNYKGTIEYYYDMPKVFNQSKINLNITIRNIRTGLSLRIWDILGAGGFLLTNYQLELEDFFENGRDIVYFDSEDDMMRKAEYYLSHEDERLTIAENGLKKVKGTHTYEERIKVILKKIKKSVDKSTSIGYT